MFLPHPLISINVKNFDDDFLLLKCNAVNEFPYVNIIFNIVNFQALLSPGPRIVLDPLSIFI